MGYHVSSGEITASISVENANKFVNEFLNHFQNKVAGKKHIQQWEKEVIEICKEHDFIGLLWMYEFGVTKHQALELYIIEEFIGEQCDDTSILQLLAPYMNDGYIEMHGEDNKIWRWVFENGEFSTKHPKIVWE